VVLRWASSVDLDPVGRGVSHGQLMDDLATKDDSVHVECIQAVAYVLAPPADGVFCVFMIFQFQLSGQ
jgi:hypothetical protein